MRQARKDASSLRTLWRLLYDMPPTDPRFLAATDDVMLEDLLARHFSREASAAKRDPRAAVQQAVLDLGGQEGAARYLDKLREVLEEQDAERRRAAERRDGPPPQASGLARAGGARRGKGTVKP